MLFYNTNQSEAFEDMLYSEASSTLQPPHKSQSSPWGQCRCVPLSDDMAMTEKINKQEKK